MPLLLCYYYSHCLFHIIVLIVIYRAYLQHMVAIEFSLQLTSNAVYEDHELQSTNMASPEAVTSNTAFTSDRFTMPPPSLPSSSSKPTISTSISTSDITAIRSLKRLSLSIPIHPPGNNSPRRSSIVTSSPDKSNPPSPKSHSTMSLEPNGFLTALAAQERRVLELREELHKAEADLEQLKKQWAINEVTKKRNDIRHAEQMRPLISPTRVTIEENNSDRSASREEDPRKALFARTRQPQRKVFEGGRHTRTLSLLSPGTLSGQKIKTGFSGETTVLTEAREQKPLARSMALANRQALPQFTSTIPSNSRGTKDDLVNTGKQLVGDLREGLWTFIEDLRQVTVGDEALDNSRPKHKRKASLGRSPGRNSNRNRAQTTPLRHSLAASKRKDETSEPPSTWTDQSHVLIEVSGNNIMKKPDSSVPTTTVTNKKATTLKTPKSEATLDDDSWDSWDSPEPISSCPMTINSTHGSPIMYSPSQAETTITSTSDASHRVSEPQAPPANIEQLPWLGLSKLSPSTLTRTASSLMKDWEASLASPLDESQRIIGTNAKGRKCD